MTQKQPVAATDDEPEFVPGYDDLAYEGGSPRTPRPPKTDSEIEAILERMAVHNPDAAAALEQRRKK
jgi:hypothetical protein